jgi:hypothetical protein
VNGVNSLTFMEEEHWWLELRISPYAQRGLTLTVDDEVRVGSLD